MTYIFLSSGFLFYTLIFCSCFSEMLEQKTIFQNLNNKAYLEI